MSESQSREGAERVASEHTQIQKTQQVDESIELSIPEHVRQDPSAPEVAGYVLVEALGEGAYGQVWRAWQQRTRKEVAVKVFTRKSGLDWIFLQREMERLARLDTHPNVVTLLDAGLEQNPPYYAIELIPGGALDEYLYPKRKATREQALHWMEQMCEALTFVHGKGLIHCDLKPANVLVDEQGHVRVVDFGQSRVFAESSSALGTLFYMAPEQAVLVDEGKPAHPDVRWDVYALGATMYAILTGCPPHGSEKNIQALEEAEDIDQRLKRYRAIIEHGRPILAQQGWGTASSGRDPRPTPIDRELSAVVLKCLAHNPDDRYKTVAGVLADLRAIREKRPVSPLAAGDAYRARKFVQRNPLQIAFAAVVLMSIIGFAVYARIQSDRITHERDAAVAARNQAEEARQAEAEQRRLAETSEASARAEARKANAIKDFLINDLLASADPEIVQTRAITVEEVLNNASERIGTALPDHPEVEASIRATIGKTYMSLGLYDAAEVHLRAADAIYETEFGGENADALQLKTELAELLRRQGNYAQSEALVRRTLEIQRRVLGNEHSDTLKSMNNLGIVLREQGRNAEAEKLHRQTLEIRRRVLGSEHLDTLKSMNNLSNVLYRQRKYMEAEKLYRHTLGISRHALGEEHTQTLNLMCNLGNVLRVQGKYVEAETFHRRTLEIQRQLLGDEHPSTLNSMHNLGLVLWQQGQIAEAATIYRKTLALRRRVLPNEHPDTLKALNNLVGVLRDQGRVEETRPYVIEQITRRKNAADRLKADANTLNEYARLLLTCEPADLRDPDSALPMAKKAVEMSNRLVPSFLDTLALAYQMTGDIAQAIETQREAVALLLKADANTLNEYAWLLLTREPADLRDPDSALPMAKKAVEMSNRLVPSSLDTLALAYQMTGDIAQAIETQREAVALLPPGESYRRMQVEQHLVSFYWDKGDLATAQQIGRDILARRRRANLSESHPFVDNALDMLGKTLIDLERFGEAEAILGECLEIRQKALPEGHWLIANTMSFLGASLAGQEKFKEAESLLLEGYSKMKDRPRALDIRKREALERIVDFYEAWGKPDKAADYRAEAFAPR